MGVVCGAGLAVNCNCWVVGVAGLAFNYNSSGGGGRGRRGGGGGLAVNHNSEGNCR